MSNRGGGLDMQASHEISHAPRTSSIWASGFFQRVRKYFFDVRPPPDSFRRRYRKQFFFEVDLLPQVLESDDVAILVGEFKSLDDRSRFRQPAGGMKAPANGVTDLE